MPDNNTKINTEELKLVMPAGLSGPRSKTSYTDSVVQQVLAESFSGALPWIQTTDQGLEYTQLDSRKRNLVAKASPVINLGDIPKGELLRLMEGWMRIRRRITEEQFPKEIQSILLNLKVPSPRSAIQRYLIHKKGDEKKLFVLWGYESPKDPHIPLERALSIFLDVPLGHLQSILTTSMSKQTTSVTSAVNINTSTVQYLQNPQQSQFPEEPASSKSKQNLKTIAVFGVAAALTATCYIGFRMATKEPEPEIQLEMAQQHFFNDSNQSNPTPILEKEPTPPVKPDSKNLNLNTTTIPSEKAMQEVTTLPNKISLNSMVSPSSSPKTPVTAKPETSISLDSMLNPKSNKKSLFQQMLK